MSKKEFSLSDNAIVYSWSQLAQRAGIIDFNKDGTPLNFCNIPIFYAHPDEVSYHGRKIIVVPCPDEDWFSLLKKPANSIDWAPIQQMFPAANPVRFITDIPVIFHGDFGEHGKMIEYRQDETLLFHVDILAIAFFMLTRWEETINPIKDEHGRFPAFESVAYKQGFLDLPIVDLYALILREWLKKMAPSWNPAPLRLKINVTHDIDWVSHFSGGVHFMKMAGGELIKKKSLKGFLNQFDDLRVQITSPAKDVFFRSIYELAELSELYGFSSKFYFMAAETSKYQQGYNPCSRLIRKCIVDLEQRGHKIGLHPGYDTLDAPEKLIYEKQRLEQALGRNIDEGRQHFLRFHTPFTWKHWEQAGFLYDSTMGFADYEGFRCGTCHPYHPFDTELDQEMKLRETPLIVMDATLRLYRNLSPEQGKNRILELASRCEDVGGTFTLLWHNTSLHGEWEEWHAAYQEVLSELSKR